MILEEMVVIPQFITKGWFHDTVKFHVKSSHTTPFSVVERKRGEFKDLKIDGEYHVNVPYVQERYSRTYSYSKLAFIKI